MMSPEDDPSSLPILYIVVHHRQTDDRGGKRGREIHGAACCTGLTASLGLLDFWATLGHGKN
jgi:hypothetical protein